MKRLLLFGLILLMFASVNAFVYTCYQETANASTTGECELNYSGNYGFSGDWCIGCSPLESRNNASAAYDGNWLTFAVIWNKPIKTNYNYYYGNASMYINYSKPINALPMSLWQIKVGYGEEGYTPAKNVTIPLDCWNQPLLQFQIYGYYNSSISTDMLQNSSCWNGSIWKVIDSYTFFTNFALARLVYEEAMIWNITLILNNSVETYNSNVYELSNQTFSTTIYGGLNTNNITAQLIYNGTIYNPDSYWSNFNITFNKTLTLSTINKSTNKSFYWKFYIDGNNTYNSSLYNQTVNPLYPNITIISPTPSETIKSLNITAIYNVTDDLNYSCVYNVTRGASMEINPTNINISISNFTFSVSTDSAVYVLNLFCNNSYSGITSSVTFYTDTRASPPPIGETGGGGGGGGAIGNCSLSIISPTQKINLIGSLNQTSQEVEIQIKNTGELEETFLFEFSNDKLKSYCSFDKPELEIAGKSTTTNKVKCVFKESDFSGQILISQKSKPECKSAINLIASSSKYGGFIQFIIGAVMGQLGIGMLIFAILIIAIIITTIGAIAYLIAKW